MIKRVLHPRQVLSSTVDSRSLMAEIMISGCKTMDSDANEAGSVFFSQHFFLRQMCYAVNQLRRGL